MEDEQCPKCESMFRESSVGYDERSHDRGYVVYFLFDTLTPRIGCRVCRIFYTYIDVRPALNKFNADEDVARI